jgi:Nucleotidyltransferase domain
MTTAHGIAEAVFGSAARGDTDEHSDRDYLIVGDDHEALARRKQMLSRRGISVSDYSWKRLKKLFASGTLFALHLKLEARIIRDSSGQLQALFSSFIPKPRYRSDFANSLKLFAPLSDIPSGGWGAGWAMDVLAVAVRNSGILLLADDGEYLFSFPSILAALRDRGTITDEQLLVLRQLRTFKRAYREGTQQRVPGQLVQAAVRAASAAFEVDIPSLDSGAEATDSTTAYMRMRLLERELLKASDGALQDRERRRAFHHLMRKVRDPHAYLWQFLNRRSRHQHEVERLAALVLPDGSAFSSCAVVPGKADMR